MFYFVWYIFEGLPIYNLFLTCFYLKGFLWVFLVKLICYRFMIAFYKFILFIGHIILIRYEPRGFVGFHIVLIYVWKFINYFVWQVLVLLFFLNPNINLFTLDEMICTSWSFVCWQDISLFWCQLSGSTSPGFLWCSNPYYPTDCCSSSENRVRTLIKRNSSVGLTMNELYHSRSEFVSSKPNKTIFCPIFALFLTYNIYVLS